MPQRSASFQPEVFIVHLLHFSIGPKWFMPFKLSLPTAPQSSFGQGMSSRLILKLLVTNSIVASGMIDRLIRVGGGSSVMSSTVSPSQRAQSSSSC